MVPNLMLPNLMFLAIWVKMVSTFNMDVALNSAENGFFLVQKMAFFFSTIDIAATTTKNKLNF
jgi:hypothetical protein